MSPLRYWCQALLLLLTCLFGSCNGEVCGSWKEGTGSAVACSVKTFQTSIKMQVKVNGVYVDIASCTPSGTCRGDRPQAYSSKLQKKSTTNELSVYVHNVNRSENEFRCVVDTVPGSSCTFEVYAQPSKPVCDPPTVVNANTEINITCRSDRVSPGAILLIAYQTDNFPTSPDFKTRCKTYPSTTNPGYNATECTVLFDVAGLKAAEYRFYGAMYPIISNTTAALENKVQSDITEALTLSAPEATLSNDCPSNNYIVSGTCNCELSKRGNPPGQARWYTQTGQVVGDDNPQDGSSTLTLSYNPTDPEPRYECRAETLLNVSSPSIVPFFPKFAYGPNSVIIETSEDSKFDLCPMENRNLTVTCKVPISHVEPRVVFTITVDGITVLDHQEGKIIANHHVQDYNFRPSSGGNIPVFCKAENAASSKLSLSKNLNLEVREPPKSTPVLMVPGNPPGSKEANVVKGKQNDITCKVDGGSPQVSEVTIICGSISEQGQGKLVALTVEVTEALNGQRCYCAARHDSGCYDEESEVLLHVRDPDDSTAQKDENDEKEADTNLALIIGVSVAAGVVIVVLVVAFICLYKKMRRAQAKQRRKKEEDYQVPKLQDPFSQDYLTPRSSDSGIYETVIDESGAPKRNSIILKSTDLHFDNPSFT